MSREKLEELERKIDESIIEPSDFNRKDIDSYQPETGELDDDNPPDEDSDSESN